LLVNITSGDGGENQVAASYARFAGDFFWLVLMAQVQDTAAVAAPFL
jgi:hypothetical protein